jgi:hypothetical protein
MLGAANLSPGTARAALKQMTYSRRHWLVNVTGPPTDFYVSCQTSSRQSRFRAAAGERGINGTTAASATASDEEITTVGQLS